MRKGSSAAEEKAERVEEIKQDLKKTHGDEYSGIQYRLWAEMIAIGTHTSRDLPPRIPMFTGGRAQKPKSELTSAFTSMAEAVAVALTPKEAIPTPNPPQKDSNPATSSHFTSPDRVADIRSKYIQQLRELHSLYEAGALTDREFADQKQPILDHLKTFN